MAKEIQELEELNELLKIEKKEDFEYFKTLIESLSLKERKEKGYTWHPLVLVKSGFTVGDRAFVVVEKTNDDETPRMFRAGKVVNLFTLEPDTYKPEQTGIIQFVNKQKMKIVLNSSDVPDWIDKGQVGVDLMFDERTYLEMEKALKKVMSAKNDRLAELRNVILGKEEARFSPISHAIEIPSLNISQNKAVNQILSAQDVAIVHGPPGTGKTTTLVHAIKLLSQYEKTVLVVAPSNTAVDVLTLRLVEAGLKTVRIGNISRVDEELIGHTLDIQLAKHPDSKNVKKLKIQAADYRRKARRYKKRFGSKERMQREMMYQEARELTAWANQLEDLMLDQILYTAEVVTCTLVGSSNKVLEKLKFKTVVIDEAAQALEPANWIPIVKASKVVLVGDPFQLPPTVKSREAQKKGLATTMIEKCLNRVSQLSFLNVQYRMNEKIMGFSNQQFYDGKLLADIAVAKHVLDLAEPTPLVFIDTAGCGFDEKFNPEFKSRSNPDEFHLLCEHLYQLVDLLEEKEMPSIAIISPYREQVIYIKETIKEDEKLKTLAIDVNTIDGFQGQERDVIYISLVRSNTKNEIGFLKDYRRMNVAMTRARKMLVVVGDSGTIAKDKFYSDFLDYCEQHGNYQSAWTYMA